MVNNMEDLTRSASEAAADIHRLQDEVTLAYTHIANDLPLTADRPEMCLLSQGCSANVIGS